MRIARSVIPLILVFCFVSARSQTTFPDMGSAPTSDDGFVLYQTAGNPNGEPVLLIHGAFVAAAFLPIMDQPALSDYYLIRYHRRGFGGSSDTDVAGWEREGADALAVLDYLGIPKAHVAGHSGGGPLALWLSRYHPERVQSVILIESSPVIPPSAQTGDGERLARLESTLESRGAGLDPNLVDEFFQNNWGDNWAVEVERTMPGAIAQARADFRSHWLISGLRLISDESFFDLEQPVIRLGSESNDGPNPRNWGKLTQMVTRNVEGVPNHAFQMIAPEPTARAIAEWLADNPID